MSWNVTAEKSVTRRYSAHYLFDFLSAACYDLFCKLGYSALMNACRGGRLDTVRALVAAGANLNLQNMVGMAANITYGGRPTKSGRRM